MSTLTMSDVARRASVQLYEHIEAELGDVIPAEQTTLCIQGDVAFIPTTPGNETGFEPVGAAGRVLVAGDHDHVLVADADVCEIRTVSGSGADVAVIRNTKTAYVVHAEHAATALAPGCWTVRRQREHAEEQRLVAD